LGIVTRDPLVTNRTRILLLSFGLLALAASVGMARRDAAAAASRTWPPARRYSAVGVVLAPAAIAAALAAGHIHVG
jgi:hypothetical protein